MSKIELLSEILSVTPRRIQQLADEGIIPKPVKKGEYDISLCVQSYYEYLYQDEVDKEIDGRKQQARKTKAEADRIEFDLDIKKNRYVDVNFIEKELEKSILNCRSKLLSLPSKAAPQLVNIKKPSEIFIKLQNIINEALDELVIPNFDESRNNENQGDNSKDI